MASPLTVILKIKPGQGRDLQALLCEIGTNIKRNPHIHFADMELIHFTRFVIMDDSMTRLLFTSVYDGTLEEHLTELISKAPQGIEMIFSQCKGYPNSTGDAYRRDFIKWITANSIKANTFFSAYPGVTVKEAKQYIELQKRIDATLNTPQAESLIEALGAIPVKPPPKPNPIVVAINKVIGAVLGQIYPLLLKIIAPHTTNERTPYKQVHIPYETTEREKIVQNELTIISDITPSRVQQIKNILGLIEFGCRLPGGDGTLNGVTTIHFARWVVYDGEDGKKKLLFESNYDGAWESYIGEFIDRAWMGLDAIWSCCDGYPKGGARDAQAFKEQIILHQHRAEVFYSAYPEDSLKNILNNIRIARGISGALSTSLGTEFMRSL